MENVKTNIKKLIDECPKFVGMKQFHVAQFFDIPHGYWNPIYHGKQLPGRDTAMRIVKKLREAGYPELRYEDVWCPEEAVK